MGETMTNYVVKMAGEKRPVLFITYSYDDPDEASVLDISGAYDDALANAIDRGWSGGPPIFVYRLERLQDGSYGKERRVWSGD